MSEVRNLIYNLDESFRNVHCLVRTDLHNKIVHVLDFYGQTALTTCVEFIQTKIAEELVLTGKISEWKWYLYTVDSTVVEFNRNETDYVDRYRFIADPDSQGHMIDMDFFKKMKSLSDLYWERYVIV
jgi:hypothetical protein